MKQKIFLIWNIIKISADIVRLKIFIQPIRWLAIIFFLTLILALMFFAANLVRTYFHEEYVLATYAYGQQRLDFRVFYLENEFFDENPIPRHLGFLMSYTDYIEIDSNFTAAFSEEMYIYYSYRSEKRFVIRNMGALYYTVFEEVFPQSEANGRVRASRLSFSAGDYGGPGGTYTIFPKEHIARYFEFVENHAGQMAEENVVARGFHGFAAELWINFTYTVRVPEFGLNETVTHGYRLSLTTELYTFVMTGVPNFDWQANIAVQGVEITFPMVMFFTALFSLGLFGLLYNINKAMEDTNIHKREADIILKKYSGEIVVYDKPFNMANYEPRTVQKFSELLKLAINLNKHIMCYRDETFTEFVVIVDGYACLYVINYNEKLNGVTVS